jgi:hypothetical protein
MSPIQKCSQSYSTKLNWLVLLARALARALLELATDLQIQVRSSREHREEPSDIGSSIEKMLDDGRLVSFVDGFPKPEK